VHLAEHEPDLEKEAHMCSAYAPVEQHLDIDQLYAAYVASHLSVDWAELVLEHIVQRRDELIERYASGDLAGCRDDDRAARVIAWLRSLPDPR
jgi:hypothetical protein